jgi:ATP-dependent Zn protease
MQLVQLQQRPQLVQLIQHLQFIQLQFRAQVPRTYTPKPDSSIQISNHGDYGVYHWTTFSAEKREVFLVLIFIFISRLSFFFFFFFFVILLVFWRVLLIFFCILDGLGGSNRRFWFAFFWPF